MPLNTGDNAFKHCTHARCDVSGGGGLKTVHKLSRALQALLQAVVV